MAGKPGSGKSSLMVTGSLSHPSIIHHHIHFSIYTPFFHSSTIHTFSHLFNSSSIHLPIYFPSIHPQASLVARWTGQGSSHDTRVLVHFVGAYPGKNYFLTLLSLLHSFFTTSSLLLHSSFITLSLFLHYSFTLFFFLFRSFTLLSLFLHPSFTSPSLFLPYSLTILSLLLHPLHLSSILMPVPTSMSLPCLPSSSCLFSPPCLLFMLPQYFVINHPSNPTTNLPPRPHFKVQVM